VSAVARKVGALPVLDGGGPDHDHPRPRPSSLPILDGGEGQCQRLSGRWGRCLSWMRRAGPWLSTPRTIPLSSLHGDECCGASSSPRSAVRQLHAVAHSVNSVDGKRRPATIWEWGRRGSSGELVPEPTIQPPVLSPSHSVFSPSCGCVIRACHASELCHKLCQGTSRSRRI